MTEQFYQPINPYASDAKKMRVKSLSVRWKSLVNDFPNFHKSGSISGMKKLYYGKGSLLVRCGDFIYNVSSNPQVYYQFAV